MPNKVDPSLSPSHSVSQQQRSASDDGGSRMSDVALRKKKNADAQAAFRARRANYIATLEETVTSLESVVLQLQDSCREARSEVASLKQQNARLRHEFREREKMWRTLWHARKSGQTSDMDELPPLPPSFSSPHAPAGPTNANMGSSSAPMFNNDGMYRAPEESSAPLPGQYSMGHNQGYPGHVSSIPYLGGDSDQLSVDSSAHHSSSQRTQKYGPYPYALQGSNRDGPWPQSIAQSSSSGGDSGHPASSSSSHSPHFVESPTLTSTEMAYGNRYPLEDQKVSPSSVDNAAYIFPSSRSLSPTTSTPPSSSSTSLTPSFQFGFSENSVPQDCPPDYDYRRHSNGPTVDVSLHSGATDMSLAGPGSDAVRHRLSARRANSGSERAILPHVPPYPPSEPPQHERAGSSEGEMSYPPGRLRSRKGTAQSTSRSPSPGPPPISGTLAVIKAQAFGALRRTRSRAKKTSEGASRVALEVLEARGIGMGIPITAGAKRQRLDDDDDDMQA